MTPRRPCNRTLRVFNDEVVVPVNRGFAGDARLSSGNEYDSRRTQLTSR